MLVDEVCDRQPFVFEKKDLYGTNKSPYNFQSTEEIVELLFQKINAPMVVNYDSKQQLRLSDTIYRIRFLCCLYLGPLVRPVRPNVAEHDFRT